MFLSLCNLKGVTLSDWSPEQRLVHTPLRLQAQAENIMNNLSSCLQHVTESVAKWTTRDVKAVRYEIYSAGGISSS